MLVRYFVRKNSKAEDYASKSIAYGGGSGIRTHGTVPGTEVFKASALKLGHRSQSAGSRPRVYSSEGPIVCKLTL